MPLFQYTAMDRKGKMLTGTSPATTSAALAETLKEQGMFLVAAKRIADPAAKPGAEPQEKKTLATSRGRVSLKELALFNQKLSLLVRSSLPILEAMTCLTSQQSDITFKAVLNEITKGIEKGESLSASFSRFPDIFDQVYLSLLRVGEVSGTLPKMLASINDYIDFKVNLRNKIRGALLYPTIVLIVAVAVVSFLVFFIVPNFVVVFDQFEVELPLPTRILLGASGHMQRWWFVYCAVIASAFFYIKHWLSFTANRKIVDTLLLNVYVLGPLVRAIVLTRTMKTLGALIGSSVPILMAIELAQAAAGNIVFFELLGRLRQRVAEGHGLAVTLAENDYIPDMVCQMVSIAERTGTLPETMLAVAEHYDKEIDSTLANVLALIEPAFVLFLGFTVGGVAVSIMIPIFRLGALVQ
jgi:type IV pilus assembly protein PilC